MPEDTDQPQSIDPLTVGELISLAEAANKSGLSHAYLKRIANTGRMRAKKSGGTWLTTLAAVEGYLKTRHRGKRTDLDKSPNKS